ncbi:DNA mismatch repair protein Msh3-like [Dermacentor andersoni]|uniref:DNA mismatch repair protein Msh3-like n=1 Tax=Dermacentor andersoni TaxID=34620 RepID=UPI002418108E|nr:DNA mismatch repair protein Msh3-like [Dermacentor andersoni]
MVPPAQLRAIIRRRAASKSQKEGSGGKTRKRDSKQSASDAGSSSTACASNKRKGLASGDFTNIKNRLCSRFGAASRQADSTVTKESDDALAQNDDAGSSKPTSYTPLESQVVAIKQRHPNTVLLVECGYRFRFFGEDAELASRELCIMCHQDHNFMTASIPVHRLGFHVERLVSRGHKVGIVRQTESAALKSVGASKSTVFTRELTALFTKSTLIGEELSTTGCEDPTKGGYLVSICEADCATPDHLLVGVVAAQPTTGEVLYDTFEESASSCELEQRLESLQPVEIVFSEKCHPMLEKTVCSFTSTSRDGVRLERLPPDYFKLSPSLDALTTLYSANDKHSSSIAQLAAIPPVVICCLGSLLEYLKAFKLEEILRDVSNFTPMSSGCRKMDLTAATLRRLDVFRNSADGTVKGSLFGHLDHTLTAFGRRMLFSWIGQPLADLELIKERQDAVSSILSLGAKSLPELRKFLSRMPDVQRGLCAILHQKVKPSDLVEILSALSRAQRLFGALSTNFSLGITSTALRNCFVNIAKLLRDVDSHLECLDVNSAKRDDMATLFKDLSDYPDLLRCHEDVFNIEEKLLSLRKDIAVQLGVATFDYKSVNGLPYLVEVPVKNISAIPRDWFKISSTKAVSRFRPPVVESLYKDLCVAKEVALMQSRKSWVSFLEKLSVRYTDYQQVVKSIATVDCFLSLAETASQAGYCRPQMLPKDPATIRIVQGRHPVLELSSAQQQYVSNDTDLSETMRCCIITGPNMGGKSSYMRQVALVVIMAHLGSYVPAESAAISLIDGIYIRMGAEDDITRWRSTFLSEMLETTEILDKCTNHSLVILDELGRGTATHDGTAIAWATLRHIVEEASFRARLTFRRPVLVNSLMAHSHRRLEEVVRPFATRDQKATAGD